MIKRDLYYERIPTKSLREDVRYLGNILGQVIKKQEGISFFNLVEKVRKLSKANKSNSLEKRSHFKIAKTLKNLSPSNTFKLTRAFSHFMNFINLAESIDASRKLNEYENSKKILQAKIFLLKKYLKNCSKIIIFLLIQFIILQKI